MQVPIWETATLCGPYLRSTTPSIGFPLSKIWFHLNLDGLSIWNWISELACNCPIHLLYANICKCLYYITLMSTLVLATRECARPSLLATTGISGVNYPVWIFPPSGENCETKGGRATATKALDVPWDPPFGTPIKPPITEVPTTTAPLCCVC